MRVNVSVSNDILDWIMLNINIDNIPNNILSYLESWKSGSKIPTFNQVEQVSKATGIPFGYFFLKTPPEEDISFVEYRTIDSVVLQKPSRNLIDVMHNMELVQQWTCDYLSSESASKLTFVGALKEQTDVMLFAQHIRKLLGIDVDWYKRFSKKVDQFNFIRTSISNTGVIVMLSGIVENNTHRPLDIKEFRAFAIVDEYAPLIFVNSNDSINGKIFSLLHEFTHICIGENSLFNDRYSIGSNVKKTEVLCNAVAAEIIVPYNSFISAWNNEIKKHSKESTISVLADRFNCGITVIARKAYDNHLINYDLYCKTSEKAVNLYEESIKKKKRSGGDYYRTAISRIDKRFFSMLLNSVYEGKTLYSDAFRLTNTNRATFGNLAESVGGRIK